MAEEITTLAACRIARIDRQRFNEFVASGDYRCAPETQPGRARRFNESDIIALFVFARELDRGIRSTIAGWLADLVRMSLTEDHDRETASVAYLLDGTPFLYVGSGTEIGDMVHGRQILKLETYNIAAIRNAVRAAIEKERETAGVYA